MTFDKILRILTVKIALERRSIHSVYGRNFLYQNFRIELSQIITVWAFLIERLESSRAKISGVGWGVEE